MIEKRVDRAAPRSGPALARLSGHQRTGDSRAITMDAFVAYL